MHIVVEHLTDVRRLGGAVILLLTDRKPMAIEKCNFNFRPGDRILIGSVMVAVRRDTVMKFFPRKFPGTDH